VTEEAVDAVDSAEEAVATVAAVEEAALERQDCEAAIEEVQKHVAALEEQVAAVATVDSAALDREWVESVSAIAPRVGIAGPTPPKSPQSPPWTPLVAISGTAVQPPVMAASSSSEVDMSHEMHASAQPSAEKEIENADEQCRLSISEQPEEPEEEQPDPQERAERAKKRREENDSSASQAPQPKSAARFKASVAEYKADKAEAMAAKLYPRGWPPGEHPPECECGTCWGGAPLHARYGGHPPWWVFRAVVEAADALDEAEAVRYGRDDTMPALMAANSAKEGAAATAADTAPLVDTALEIEIAQSLLKELEKCNLELANKTACASARPTRPVVQFSSKQCTQCQRQRMPCGIQCQRQLLSSVQCTQYRVRAAALTENTTHSHTGSHIVAVDRVDRVNIMLTLSTLSTATMYWVH